MKFDFVIGNPPYQEETSTEITTNGQKSRKNIFHHFQKAADEIAEDGSVMIYPGGRWIHQSGKGLKQFGYDQINDHHLSKIVFYPDSKELFGHAADLSDGISIVLKNAHKTTEGFEYNYIKGNEFENVFLDNPGDDLIPLNPKDFKISAKIKQFVSKKRLPFLSESILPRSLFGIESEFVEKNPDKVRLLEDNTSFDKNKEIKLFTNDKAGKSGRAKWYIANRNVIKSNREALDKWKVVVSSANAGGQKRDNQIEILDNYSAFGRSRVALRIFDTKKEAENFYNYCQTFFIKYTFLLTDEALSSLGKMVPDMIDYSNNNQIIDFSIDLDNQLYKIFGLSDEEVDFIRDRIENLR